MRGKADHVITRINHVVVLRAGALVAKTMHVLRARFNAMPAGNAIVDGIAASNFVVQEDHGVFLDPAESEHIKYKVRVLLFACSQLSFSRAAECISYEDRRR